MIAKTPRQAAKREQIRSAARDLFLKNGYAQTSMDAVTAAAGISKETLYRYYETKADLFADVLGQLIARPGVGGATRPRPRPPSSAQEFQAQLVDFAVGYLSRVMSSTQLDLLRVVIAEASRFPDVGEAFRAGLAAAGTDTVMATILDAQSSGLLASWVDPRKAARALAGLLLVFIIGDGLLAATPKLPSRRQVDELIRIFVAGVTSRTSEADFAARAPRLPAQPRVRPDRQQANDRGAADGGSGDSKNESR
jgi:TetR/AcrR family transcriptional regulator, mexJK operon transcriptional repressor